MKKSWEVKELGDVIEIRNGRNQQQVLSKNGQYPIMGSAGNLMGYATDYICEAGTTIIGRKGNISKPIFINERFWNVDTAFGFYPKNEKETDKKIIYYLCLSIDFAKMNRGTTIPSLVKSELQKIQVRLPILSEQKRIVSILDEAFANISKAKNNAEQNLKNAKELFVTYLENTFTNKGDNWEEERLGDIASVEYGYTDNKSTADGGDYRYIRITDIDNNGELIKEDKKYINTSKEAVQFILEDNDLLMARTGATYAKVLLYKNYEPSVFASYLIRIKFNSKIENKLYWYFSKSKNYWTQANELSTGTAQPQFNGAVLKQVIFPFPKLLKDQQLLIKKLDTLSLEIRKLEAIYEQKLKDLEELKKSILQKSFNGEL